MDVALIALVSLTHSLALAIADAAGNTEHSKLSVTLSIALS